MDKQQFIQVSLIESAATKERMAETMSDDILRAVDLLCEAVRNGGKILFCGNGGSAADSQHLATEFVIRLSHDLDRPAIPALALTTDTSNLTAGGNDIGFERVFARSIEALGTEGDVLIAISTSGNSPNIIRAIEMARLKKMSVIGFLGGSGGKMKDIVDLQLIIPSDNVQRIQEGHITLGHILCELVERELYDRQ